MSNRLVDLIEPTFSVNYDNFGSSPEQLDLLTDCQVLVIHSP